MGLLRFLLAALVAISHTGIQILGYNPGVVAVISFFLLSGYVMTQLLRKHYLQPFRLRHFYLDRAARLFPQYLFYFVLASLLLWQGEVHSIFTHQLTPTKWLLNLPILPLGFYMLGLEGALVIPQAWSLGLEMCFYLCIPWLLRLPHSGRHALAAASLLVFLAAFIGLLDTDLFGYRLLPGTLFMFLAGAAFAENHTSARRYLQGVFLLTLVLLAVLALNPALHQRPYNKEVLLGLALGLPMLAWLKNRPFSRLDAWLGDLSYGVFLNHFIVIWWLQTYHGVTRFGGLDVVILLVVSTAASLVTYGLVERPALAWRHALRRSAQSAPSI
jgi:peptidoglycan/LPS O-acetylase OafA/YrhL